MQAASMHMPEDQHKYLMIFELTTLMACRFHRYLLTPQADQTTLMFEVLELASQFAGFLEAIAKTDMFTFLHDAGLCHLSNTGIILYQVSA